MAAIGGEQQLELLVLEMLIQRLSHGHVPKTRESIRVAPTEVRKQPEHVDLAHKGEEFVECPCFFRKFSLQFSQIEIEIRRNCKVGTVKKMKMIHWIHLDADVYNAEIQKQFPRDRCGVSEQRVKVGGGIEGVTFAPERAAISADHIVLLSKQHAQPLARQQVRADQTA